MAILDYLQTSGYGRAADAFKEEAQIDLEDLTDAERKRINDLLVKKWYSLASLAAKLEDCERRIKVYEQSSDLPGWMQLVH